MTRLSSLEQAQSCLRQLDKRIEEAAGGRIAARVKTAEREGRMEEALRVDDVSCTNWSGKASWSERCRSTGNDARLQCCKLKCNW